MRKGVNSTQILTVVLTLPKEHPKRNALIDLMNSAFRMSGTLPKARENKFVAIIKDLKKEGIL